MTIDFSFSITSEPSTERRWGGKRHRKRRRERIFGNRLRRELRHMDAQDAQVVAAHWRRVHEFGMDHVIAVEFVRMEEAFPP